MSLRFIYGRAGSGKTRYCLNEIKASLTAGKLHPLVLLVPEQFTFQAEKDLINVLGTGGILKAEVLSFRRLAFRVFNTAGGITYPHIHPAGKCMIIYRILDKMRDRFKVFAKSADRQGFVNTLSNLITEFKRYNITPAALEEVTKELGENNPLHVKLEELSSIYAAFEKTLEDRYRDADDDLTLASVKLKDASLYDGAEIWVDGFSSFTPQEDKLIGCLMQKAYRVNISLCTDCLKEDSCSGEIDLFAPQKSAYRKFQRIALENDIVVEDDVALNQTPFNRFARSPELAHLERNFSVYPYSIFSQKTKDIVLFSSLNIFTEVEAAARDIIKLCRDEGMRYRDIAVTAGNLLAYERLIQVIFEEYEIPCFIDRKVDIANHPLARLVLSMLDIFTENWSYEAVFRYLKTGLTGIDRNSIDRLENYVLACGIRGRYWTDQMEWSMNPELFPGLSGGEADAGKQEDLLQDINEIRHKVSAPLMEFRKKTKGKKNAASICSALYDYLCEIEVPARIEAYIVQFRESGQLTLAGEYSQVWNIVMAVFDQMVEVVGDESFSIERFSNVLRIGLGEYKAGLIPASLDQVLAGSMERTKSHEVKALFILGANDGVFPPNSTEEGVLSDMDRAVLKSAGIELASDTRTKAFDEQYLVYRSLTASGKYLRISWPIADQEGRTMRPAIVISRLRKLFPNITETSNILHPDSSEDAGELAAGKIPSFRRLMTVMRCKFDGEEIHPVWREIYRWFAAQEGWQQKCGSARTALFYKNIALPVSRGYIALLYGDPVWSSVSRLEKYSACPFAYYIQYGLGAGERRVFRLSPPDVGTFMHAVIERFSRMIYDMGISWRDFEQEWCTVKVSEIIDEMLEKMQGSGIAASRRYTALALRLKRVVARAVSLIAEHMRRSSFNPVGYEMDFREGGRFPPIAIELPTGEKVYLTGRIDRIDALKTENGTYLRIVDYKSGSREFKLSDVYYGLQIQLITYMDAIWGNYEALSNTSAQQPQELDTRMQELGRQREELGRLPEEPDTQPEGLDKQLQTNEGGRTGIIPPVIPGGMLYFHVDDPIIKKNCNSTEEEVEQAIMKQLRMNGLLLADVRLVKEMDKTIDGSSLIIPATVNKGDVLGKNTSAASLEQFKSLRKYVRKLLENLCSEIMKGNVSIKPYKKKGITSCKYCSFSAICQFDTAMGENTFKLLHDKDNEAVWNLIEGGELNVRQ